MTDLVLARARIPGRAVPVDITLDGGRITAIDITAIDEHGAEHDDGTRTPSHDRTEGVRDCAGDVVLPGLVEPHLHLDKALLDAERPNPDGTLAGAIAVTGELKRSSRGRPGWPPAEGDQEDTR